MDQLQPQDSQKTNFAYTSTEHKSIDKKVLLIGGAIALFLFLVAFIVLQRRAFLAPSGPNAVNQKPTVTKSPSGPAAVTPITSNLNDILLKQVNSALTPAVQTNTVSFVQPYTVKKHPIESYFGIWNASATASATALVGLEQSQAVAYTRITLTVPNNRTALTQGTAASLAKRYFTIPITNAFTCQPTIPAPQSSASSLANTWDHCNTFWTNPNGSKTGFIVSTEKATAAQSTILYCSYGPQIAASVTDCLAMPTGDKE